MKNLSVNLFLILILLVLGAKEAPAQQVKPLANKYSLIFESPNPTGLFTYSPSILVLPSGRYLASFDLGGPDMKNQTLLGRVYQSNNKGKTWSEVLQYPFIHSRLFLVGGSVYLLGHNGDLMITRSDDEGKTWTTPVKLTEGEIWHQAPCNVLYTNDCIYLVMEKKVANKITTWDVGELAPILLRAPLTADLTKKESWTFASQLGFPDVMPGVETGPEIDFFGVPFYSSTYPKGSMPAPRRGSAPIGWLETNVVQFSDPNHIWYDEAQKTIHLWMRSHTGGTGYACIAKVVEQGEKPGTGAMITSLEKVPSGKTILYIPCPGGQMKFHVLYDAETQLYWLLSTQSTDSMTKADRLPSDRFNLPNNERRRLQLHFSKNMVDWCFAGLVAVGPVERASRHYAAMAIDEKDLLIVSRSGDEKAKDPHNGNLITFHRLKNFRSLVY